MTRKKLKKLRKLLGFNEVVDLADLITMIKNHDNSLDSDLNNIHNSMVEAKQHIDELEHLLTVAYAQSGKYEGPTRIM